MAAKRVCRRWVVKAKFDGLPKKSDFELVEETLPDAPLAQGEIYVEAVFLSVDPYTRLFVAAMEPPFTMIGETVYRVVESTLPKEYPVGAIVCAKAGWTASGILKPLEMKAADVQNIRVAPDIGSLSPSLLLGACGMPGVTAYFGFLGICKPKQGETVVVTGAAGAVGTLVGQLAKNAGCRVVGFAGTDEKCQFLTGELGFDAAFNYKKTTMEAALKEGAPNGVDCFFDNVGGPASSVIINNMNDHGRITVCGFISGYNDASEVMVPSTGATFVAKQLTMKGFLSFACFDRWNEGIEYMAKQIQEGKLKVKETVVEGFENTPEAFIGLFSGSNTGKMIVKA